MTDLRFAIRSLTRHRSFALAVVLTLGLGIAANTVVFSLISGALLRSPPFPAAERLVIVYRTAQESGREPTLTRWSHPRFERLRQESRSFARLAAFGWDELNLAGDGDPERVAAEVVSPGYFAALERGPALGRTFNRADDSAAGGNPVAVLGHALWVRRFGADSAVLGRTIRVNGEPLAVIGVMPAGFEGLTGRGELWIPDGMAPHLTYPGHLTTEENFISVVGRLAPGVTLDRARAELAGLGAEIERALPDETDLPTSWGATAIPLAEARIDPGNRRSLVFLFAAVGLLLLLACVNVAGLGVAQSVARRQEIVVRLALGAGRGRLIRQLLTESALLGLVGGGLGALVAAFLVRSVRAPAVTPGPANMYGALGDFASRPMDGAVLAFSIVVSVLAVLGSGLIPALHASRTDLVTELKDRTASAGTRRGGGNRVQAALVVAEVALALMLSVGAGLLFASLRRFQAYPLGIEPEHVLTFAIRPSEVRYPAERAPALIDRVLQAVARVPGVRTATVDACPPLGTRCARSTLYVIGRPEPRPEDAPGIMRHYVGPDHFTTLGIPLLAGRAFRVQDGPGAPPVAIVNRTAAERFFPGQDPLGRRVWFGGGSRFDRPDSAATIVGVVGDVPYGSLERGPVPSVYTPYRQFSYASRLVMVRADGDPLALVEPIRRAVRTIDDLPISEVEPLTSRLGDAWSRTRFTARLMAVFALVALLLAAGGVYAIISHSVGQRTRELGVRSALGASMGDLVRLVVGEGLGLALWGVGIGLAGALAGGRLIRSLLFEVSPGDPVVLAGLSAVLVAAAAVASYLPARRAARVDPVTSLRAD